jgi:DNA-binding NarL/FixJ family response regulator
MIVEDHPLVIEGLRRIFEAEHNFEIHGIASTESEFKTLFSSFSKGVILLDIKLKDCSGIDLCQFIKQSKKDVKVVALTTFSQDYYIRSMIDNGAISYLLKDSSPEAIINAVYSAYEGISNHSQIIENFINTPKEQSVILSKREIEVLKLIAEGLTNQQVAEKLFLSPLTIDSHRKNMILKFRVQNTASLIKAATLGGWLD